MENQKEIKKEYRTCKGAVKDACLLNSPETRSYVWLNSCNEYGKQMCKSNAIQKSHLNQ